MSTLRELLAQVHSEYGQLDSRTLVSAATPVDHPLHERFEWDDSIAGHAHRLAQAANMIRSVRVTFERADGTLASVRQYVIVSTPPVDTADEERIGGYRRIEDVAQDPELADRLLADMRLDWRAFKSRWKHMAEYLAEVTGE